MLLPNKITYIPFIYFKTSNQGYLILFHSILFHSFPLLNYIPFHSIYFYSLMIIWFPYDHSIESIPFHFIPLWTPKRSILFHSIPLWTPKRGLRPRLGGENGMKWKWMKIIILEYSSIPLFGSFNGGNWKLILLFESLSKRE